MALKNILAKIASEEGFAVNVDAERLNLIAEINDAAEELYSTRDLAGCEREQIFEIAAQLQQFTFPWYIERVLKYRDYETRVGFQEVDMRVRYMVNDWVFPFMEPRNKYTRALSTQITNTGYLTFTFSQPLLEDMTITVIGETDNAAKTSETISFSAGDTIKQGSLLFKDVFAIRKSATTASDLSVTDIDGTEISSIPNHLLEARFHVVQFRDRYSLGSASKLIEVLFKARLEPMQNDDDIFTAGEEYDDAIYWKTLSRIWATLAGKTQDAIAAEAKCIAIINSVEANKTNNEKRMLLGEPSPWLDLYPKGIRRFHTIRRP